jgi:hypothetical protein
MASEIARKRHSLGMEFLGNPTGPEKSSPDRVGRYRHFQGGAIYWHPDTGAHEVHGVIREKWKDYDWERGFLGYPTTDETPTPDGIGRYNHFQHGSIYWSPSTGAREVHGAIRSEWANLGWEGGWLGYPKTDEISSPDGVRYSHFEGGYLLWTPEVGVKAYAEGPNKDRTDPSINFDLLTQSDQGNLQEFCAKMSKWYGIDLREGMINKGTDREKRINGWPFVDFEKRNTMHGQRLKSGERLILTAARILLMQWLMRDLRKHKGRRHDQINRYCGGCFKKRYDGGWSYHNWCSEFASYLYLASGNRLKIRQDQHFTCKNIARRERNAWCGRTIEAMKRHFLSDHRWRDIQDYRSGEIEPSAGDYIRTDKHSMVVLWYDQAKERIYIIDGNFGSPPPEGPDRRVRWGWVGLHDANLAGIGGSRIYLGPAR